MAKGGGDGSKRDFVEAQPLEVPAPRVAELAKEAGIHISVAYVYQVRAQNRKAAERPKPLPPASAPSNGVAKVVPKVAMAPVASLADLESQFAALVLEIGLARAEQLIAAMRKR